MKKNFQTKQALEWHFASLYLDMLKGIHLLNNDEEFCKKHRDLMAYIDGKIVSSQGGDILKTFVVVEQEQKE